jgi:hypothetical protein
LERVEKLLGQATLPAAEVARLSRHIAALKSDLQSQAKANQWTLGGVFPLTGFLTSSMADAGPAASYQLIDDPATKATTNAAADLLALAAELGKKQTQLPVVFTCVAYEPGAAGRKIDRMEARSEARSLEHAACRVFRESPHFDVQTPAKVDEALSPAGDEVRAAYQAGNITTAVVEQLHKAFGPTLLVVVIRQADVFGDICYYQTEGRILEANKPQQSFSTTGFGRDRRDRLAWILWANAALLLGAYAAYALIVRTHSGMAGDRSWTTLLVLPLVAFVLGRSLPYLVSPLLGMPGGPGIYRHAAGGLLAGRALVRHLVAEFESVESRRCPVYGNRSRYCRLPCRPTSALLGDLSSHQRRVC